MLGERACAVVVPRPGETVSLAGIVAYLREIGIATFKLPERLELRDELPRNPLGKDPQTGTARRTPRLLTGHPGARAPG